MNARDTEPPRPAHPAHRAEPGDSPSVAALRTIERRRRQRPTSPAGYLEALPARILLDRLLTSMLAVGLDGVLVYANPACARMLGHNDARVLTGLPLSAVLADHAHTAPRDCVTALKVTGTTIVDLRHADGFRIRTVISAPLLLREDDPLLLISITDVTDMLWMTCRQQDL
jgi:PAS domain-containing protein